MKLGCHVSMDVKAFFRPHNWIQISNEMELMLLCYILAPLKILVVKI